MTRNSGFFCLLVLVIALGCVSAGDQATRFDKDGHTMMCVCGCNQVLLECNHVGCQYSDKMRVTLADMISGGSSDDQIFQSFVQEYGTTVVAAPMGGGFNRLAWIMPFAVLFAGVLGAGLMIRKWHRPLAPQAAAADEASDAEREQIRKDTRL